MMAVQYTVESKHPHVLYLDNPAGMHAEPSESAPFLMPMALLQQHSDMRVYGD
jgi:hypothetical protein